MFEQVKEAFNRQSEIFDEYEKQNEILKRMRLIVRKHLLIHLRTGDRILELNSGTGLDAVFLAKNGFYVQAIDISEGMLSKLEAKVNSFHLQNKISHRLLSFTELDKLNIKPFDYIFSNFGGLNCVDDLSKVTKHFSALLKPKGKITLVIMPPISLWELLSSLKMNFRFAFRRFNRNGTFANVEGIKFKTYYHSLKKLKHTLGKNYKLIEVLGLSAISPPPYANKFSIDHPSMYNYLNFLEDILSRKFPFNRCADHYIATFQFIP